MSCIFCAKENLSERFVAENDLAYAMYDAFPVNKGHILVIPKRHFANWFDSSVDEREALFLLLDYCKEFLDKHYHPDGYNVGINCGEAAGQTIMHLHVHLIPRYVGDIKEPRGGVRGVIPERMPY